MQVSILRVAVFAYEFSKFANFIFANETTSIGSADCSNMKPRKEIENRLARDINKSLARRVETYPV